MMNRLRGRKASSLVHLIIGFWGISVLTGCSQQADQTLAQNAPKAQNVPDAQNTPDPAPTQKIESPAPRANQAPDFMLLSLTGETVRLSDYQGRVVLVDFWATWCGPCRRTIPDLIELYRQHNVGGFDILGIALERPGTDRLAPYVQQNNIPYPVLIGTPNVVQSYGSVRSIPTAFLIGRDGTVRQRYVGVQPRDVLEKAILELLAEPPPA